jgi:DNA-binding phage protein
MRKTYLEKLKTEAAKKGVARLSKDIGLSYSQLYRIITGISKGTIDSWEIITLYYKKQF